MRPRSPPTRQSGCGRCWSTGASFFEAVTAFGRPRVAAALGRGRGRGLPRPPSAGAGAATPGFAPSAGLDARSRTRDRGRLRINRWATRMLRLVVAVLMLVSVGAVVASGGRSSAPAPIKHVCGLTDRQFIVNYQLQIAEVGMT